MSKWSPASIHAANALLRAVGTGVGDAVGAAVGASVGASVGLDVGLAVGEAVGAAVGASVGLDVGLAVGEAVGLEVGAEVGLTVGDAVGATVGLEVGAEVGLEVGEAVGDAVGVTVGTGVEPLPLPLFDDGAFVVAGAFGALLVVGALEDLVFRVRSRSTSCKIPVPSSLCFKSSERVRQPCTKLNVESMKGPTRWTLPLLTSTWW